MLGIFGLAGDSEAAIPNIDTVSSAISDGQSITIGGSNFGSKTTAAPFRSSYGNPVANMNFQQTRTIDPSYWTNYVPSCTSIQNQFKRTNGSYMQLAYTAGCTGSGLRTFGFPMASGKYYLAWWDYLSSDFDWTQMSTGASAIKYVYLNAGSNTHNALCVQQNGTLFAQALGGIDGSTAEEQDANFIHPFYSGGFYARPLSWVVDYHLPLGQWYFIEMIYQMNSAQGVHDGSYELRVNNQQIFKANNADLYPSGTIGDPGFEDVALGGNYGWNGGLQTYYRYYGDIYFDDSFAKVIIGDNQDYTKCTHREIQIPTVWGSSGNSITFNAKQGTFANGTAYLFVMDDDGNVSAGKQITLGSGGSIPDATLPAIPSGLSVS